MSNFVHLLEIVPEENVPEATQISAVEDKVLQPEDVIVESTKDMPTETVALELQEPVSGDPSQTDTIQPVAEIHMKAVEEEPLTKDELESLAELVGPTALEVVLDTSTERLKLISKDAFMSQIKAANSIHTYLQHMSEAMVIAKEDETYESVWKSVIALEEESQESIDLARTNETGLNAEVESVKDLITSVRKSGHSEAADNAEELVNSCKSEMVVASNDIQRANRDFEFFLDYLKLMDNAPDTLRNDLKEFTPDLVKLMQLKREDVDIEKLSKEDAVLSFALKRAEFVLSQLEQEKVLASKNVQELLEKQKEELLRISEEAVAVEIKRVEAEKRLEQERKVFILFYHSLAASRR